MPHHSVQSWCMYVSKTVRAEVEEIRKRVGIAYRLATTARRQDLESPSKRPRLNDPTNQPNHSAAHQRTPLKSPTAEQEDLDVICNFFASGQGNDEDDELVWENLTKYVRLVSAHLWSPLLIAMLQKRCKTAAEWPEFYKQREQLINDRIRMLLDEAAASETDIPTAAMR
jgi:hypothetical protein